MLTYTDSVVLIWKVAAWEAICLKHKFIEKEHVFSTFCKAHELLQDKILKQIGITVPVEAIREELSPVLSTLEANHINPGYLHRRIRILLDEGGYEHKKGEVIYRSEECKRYFRKADELAKGYGAVFLYPVHLFIAILLEPVPNIERVLKDLGVTPQRLLETVRKRGVSTEGKPKLGNEPLVVSPDMISEPEDMAIIIRNILESLKARLAEKNQVYVSVRDDVVEFLITKGYKQESGAGNLRKVIEELVDTPLCDRLLAEEIKPGERIVIDVSGDEIVFTADYSTDVG
jgi:ATP-dependent Clp protease ATP-binding subunit ClpA